MTYCVIQIFGSLLSHLVFKQIYLSISFLHEGVLHEGVLHEAATGQVLYTGWPKSNVPKVRAYYSASDHLIRKIFSGVWRDILWFEEYLKIIEIDDHFFE